MKMKTITSVGVGFVVAIAIAGCDDKDSGSHTGDAPSASASSASTPTASGSATEHGSAAPHGSGSAEAKHGDEPGTPTTADDKVDPDEQLAADEVRDHHRYHRGGIVSFIDLSLDTLGVAAERKAAVDKIQGELDVRLAPLHTANRELLTKLADGVAAGKVDATKSDADLANVARAEGSVRTTSAELVNELHKTLSPQERAALADKVEAHWQVWREANADEKAKKEEKGKAGEDKAKKEEEHDTGRIATLTKDLSLTPDQVTKIDDGLKAKAGGYGPIDPKVTGDIDARLKEFTAAFAGEKFDAKTLSTWEAVDSKAATTGGTRIVRLCEVAAPILTPEQRTKFANQLREHANAPAEKK
jgi:Spy/CpxP family protein refolding chaperone